ncbi:translational activator GCN1 [Thraustotheca clavata]|uniref:Translational activator GCN1 n=1 Tax=Thraustotheca clavata TaxID=74557 RepID=A0A1V9Z733_9STRA|nr:translational activator GCN1 [Thraustotheca clavata]
MDVFDQLLDEISLRPSASTIAAHMLSVEESFKESPMLKKTANLLLNTVARCQHRTSVKHLLALLDAFVQADEGFAAAFTERVVARAKAFVLSFPTARTTIVRLIARVLTSPTLSASNVASLLQAQCLVLEANRPFPETYSTMEKAIVHMCKSNAEIFKQYVDIATSTTGDVKVLLESFLIDAFVKEFTPEEREKWIASVVYQALESKNRPPASDLKAFAPLLSTVTAAEFENTVAPVLSRMLKRAPDSVLDSTVALLNLLPTAIDLSQYVATIFGSLFPAKLKSVKDDVRESCIALVAAVVTRCKDPTAISSIVTDLIGLLDGKFGLLAQFYMRDAAFQSLNHVAVSVGKTLGSTAARELANNVVLSGMCKSIAKEANDVARNTALWTLAQWVTIHTPSHYHFTSELLALFESGLNNKIDTVVVAYLRALVLISVAHAETLLQAPSLQKRLIAIVQEAQMKPNIAHLDGVLALTILSNVNLQFPEVGIAMDSAGIGSFLLQDSFFKTSVTLIAQSLVVDSELQSPEATALQAVGATLCRVWRETSDGEQIYSFDLLVRLLTHRVASVRKPTEESVQNLVQDQPWTAVPLLNALSSSLVQFKAWSSKGTFDDSEALVYNAQSTLPSVAGILRRSLRAIVPLQVETEFITQLFPRLLLLSHNPLVVHGSRKEKFNSEWNRLKVRFVPEDERPQANPKTSEEDEDDEDDIPVTIHDTVDDLFYDVPGLTDATVIALKEELYASATVRRISAHRALVTLLEFAGNGHGEALVLTNLVQEQVATILKTPEITNISQEDVEIYFTPEDTLYTKTKKKADEPAPQRGGTEDERWEAQVRAELAKKRAANPNNAAKKVKYTKEELEQLAAQKQIRAAIHASKHLVSCTDELLGFVANTNPEAFQQALPHLVGPLLSLLSSPMFSSFALRALQHLGRCVMPANLRAHASEIATGLHLSHAIENDLESPSRLNDNLPLFERIFSALSTNVFGSVLDSEDEVDLEEEYHLLTPSTLHIVFPILRTFLRYSMACRQFVLPLFAVHAKMISEEEEMEVGDMAAQRLLRRSMLEVTLEWLDHDVKEEIPTLDNLSPDVVLTQICRGAPLSSDEWEPLIGDSGLLSTNAGARHACLKAIMEMVDAQFGDDDEEDESNVTLIASEMRLVAMLSIALFDEDAENKSLAEAIWPLSDATITKDIGDVLLPLLRHPNANVRDSAAAALASAMKQFPDITSPILKKIQSEFVHHIPSKGEAELDSFGMPIVRRHNEGEADEGMASVLPRLGAGVCMEYCAKYEVLSRNHVMSCVQFILSFGLGDLNNLVRNAMRKAGVQMMDSFGAVYTNGLLSLLEEPIDAPPSNASVKELEAYDHKREGIVVCLGSLAKHMDKLDPKVSSIVNQLLEALSIPSESVQRAIATCLSPLMVAVKDQSPLILDDLLTKATTGESYGIRMGAAFGVSAVVKGLGIAALKQHSVIPRLEEAMKISNPNAREGALSVMECLCERLGFLFEPYVIVILPILLKSFADTSAHVRQAASGTAKGIMRNLSAHGVKLILPSILRAVDDPAWRTKQAAIQLLGTMASCAPKQLGSCLPQIIPKLTIPLSDSHPRVKEAGQTALTDIARVIRNPEIASISTVLLAGLQDPNRKTTDAMQALQSMKFIHSIDAPSLALVMPVLQRGLTDRISETKKKAALIVGNMCSMVNDAKDLAPYLDTISPCLQTQLLDPIPEVRTVASKALGMLVKGLGQSHFPHLVPSLLQAIKSETSSVERSGSAQGLCEVLVNLGVEALDNNLRDEIFPIARHPKFAVREGVLWVLAFLPPALGKGFSKYLSKALPMIVSGLSDESESVRDVAMHAGSIVVNAHAITNTNDILPSLEAGIFDDNWRIRQSSIALLGDLLYRVSGTKAVAVSNDDDDDVDGGSAAGEKAMLKILGKQRRDAVLSALYMVRSDTSAVVRQSALQVWKSVVSNTPKTLRSILESLMLLIVQALSGTNVEKQTVAGRTLGEIVRKLGEHVMPEVVPILRSGLDAMNPGGMRQGVCLGLAEVIQCSPKKQLEDYVDTLVMALEEALCDVLPEVRRAAGSAFDVFHKIMGYRSIDELIPRLLKRITSVDDLVQERALAGVQEVLKVKSREVLPYLVPRLLTTPMSMSNVQAIAHIATASGAVLHYHMDRIIQVLFTEYVSVVDSNDEMASAIQTSLRAVALGVEPAGVQWLASEICKYCESDNHSTRYLACWLIAAFCQSATVSYEEQVPIFLKYVLGRFNDSDAAVVQAASAAFNSLNSTIRPEELAKHIDFIRNNLNAIVSDARHRKGGVGATGVFVLPALSLAKGLDPFLPAYQYALMNGTPEARQSAAAGLGELVHLASAVCLKSVLIKVTGPLIRIAGDRFPGHVKAAILSTLEILLVKGGVALKPFLPQLQTTFVKALNDASAEVRACGGSALVHLVVLAPRIDPLVSELTDKLISTSGGIQESNLAAVLAILRSVGSKISSAGVFALEDALRSFFSTDNDNLRSQASTGMALALSLSGADHGIDMVVQLVQSSFEHWPMRHSAALLCQSLLSLPTVPEWVVDSLHSSMFPVLVTLSHDENAQVRSTCMNTFGLVVKLDASLVSPELVQAVVVGLTDSGSKDVNRTALRVVKRMAKLAPKRTRSNLSTLVPPTFLHIKSSNIGVKFAAERALLYLLEIQTRPETITEYCAGADQGKLLAEYARRVLSKLKVTAGDEDSDDDSSK